jgi:hypothetical protein
MKRPHESEFEIVDKKAIHRPTGWEIWLDQSEVGRPRHICWSLGRPAESRYEEQVKVMATLLLEKRGF